MDITGYSCGHCGQCSTTASAVFFADCEHGSDTIAETDYLVLYFGCYYGKTLLELWTTTPWYITVLYTQLMDAVERRELASHLPAQWTCHHANHYLAQVRHWIKSRLHCMPMDLKRLDDHAVQIDTVTKDVDLLTLVVHGSSR
jgi:hypothetical protein